MSAKTVTVTLTIQQAEALSNVAGHGWADGDALDPRKESTLCRTCSLNLTRSGDGRCSLCVENGVSERISCDNCAGIYGWGSRYCSNSACRDARKNRQRYGEAA